MSKPLSNTTNTPPAPAGSWQGSDARMAVPNTSMLPGSDQAPPAADAMLARVAQGAHDTIDRLADSVAPRVHQVGESLAGAEAALHNKADELRAVGSEWSDSLRRTVRSSPLAAVAAALALGALIARLRR